MDIDSFDFGRGTVTYLSPELFADEPPDSATEDLMQVNYPIGNLLIDVGWHSGRQTYIVCTIVKRDWENPVFLKRTKTLKQLKLILNEAIKLANSLSEQSDGKARLKERKIRGIAKN